MRYDSGELTIYKKTNVAEPGRMPVASYTRGETLCYADLTVGISRYNQARQNDALIDLLVRVPRTYGVRANDVVTIRPYSHPVDESELYAVYQAQLTTDEDGLPVTDLSLERYEGIDAGKALESIRGAR